jgi:lipoprotein-anchoring transpeptidase ErfK/SrfK
MRRAALTALAVALSTAAGTSSALAASPRAAVPKVPVTQPLVILLQDHVARATASTHARVIEPVAALRPLTKVRTVLPVMGAVRGKDGNRWVHVRLPGRPSGHTGWILADQTIRSSTEWRIVVTVSTRRVTVYRDGLVVRVFPAVVPKPSTPTPYGQFFVEEALAISSNAPGGPFALAISARSDIFQEFEGGPGQIAIHGTDGLSDPLGSAASHGCIRISPSAVTWLSSRIGGGVPVTVQP